jgi:hypothetical protein
MRWPLEICAVVALALSLFALPSCRKSQPDVASAGTKSCAEGRYLVLDPGTSEDNGDGTGTVRDTRTGLTWMRKAYRPSQTQAQAQAYCQSKGMRLPTKEEAMGIAGKNYDITRCAFPYFWRTWTSTPAGSGVAWYILSGGAESLFKVDFAVHQVLCVR